MPKLITFKNVANPAGISPKHIAAFRRRVMEFREINYVGYSATLLNSS
jgi:hypothetical protein